MTELLKNFFRGMVIGIANVIPGVSGGTMAVVMGIYDKLLAAVSLKNLRKNLPFLISLAAGAGAAILLFSRLVVFLYETYPMPTCFAFIGLIIGSIPLIFKKATEGGFSAGTLIPFFVGLGIMVVMFLLNGSLGSQPTVRELSVGVFFWLMALGAVAAFSMIVPGISGSFVMLLLGGYTTTLTAVSELNFPLLLPIGIGICIGLVGGLLIIKKLLALFPRATYMMILGLVMGSVISIFPGFSFDLMGLISVFTLIAGAAVAYLFAKD